MPVWLTPAGRRMSRLARQLSGTTFGPTPPWIMPTFSVARPRRGSGPSGMSIFAISSSTACISMMALRPRCGMEPCAVTPSVSTSSQNVPFCAMYT